MVRYAAGNWSIYGKGVLAALTATLFVLISLNASAADAQDGPRWVVEAVTMPTHLQTNAPRNEVQKLSITATGGEYQLEVKPRESGEGQTQSLQFDATASQVQAALVSVLGAGGVSVTGGPGTATPSEYQVNFENGEGNFPIRIMGVNTKHLTGGTASVTEVTHGAMPQEVTLMATNVGGAATNGSTITIADALPSWLTATHVEGVDAYAAFFYDTLFGAFLGGMTCAAPPTISCTYSGKVDPGDQLYITVTVSAGAAPIGAAVNRLTVSGGGAAEVATEASWEPDSSPVEPGPAPEGVFAEMSSRQAGAHPNVVTSFWLNSDGPSHVAGMPKDVRFDLPAGLVGSTVGMPRCTVTLVIKASNSSEHCPADTMVGVAEVVLAKSENGYAEQVVIAGPVYNVAPYPGEPAAFAFDALVEPVRLDTTVLSNGDYGVRVTAGDLSENATPIGSTVTIWGVPQEHSGPGGNSEEVYPSPHTLGGLNKEQSPTPLLTNPQQCRQSLRSMMSVDTWAEPGNFKWAEAPMGTLSGCLNVPFGTSFGLLPDTVEAGAPAGYHFELHVSQQNTAGTLATSSVKEVALKMPAGVVVNPSAAWGLKACSTTQFYGPHHPSQEPAELAGCPREAEVGEVEVETPDLEHPLKGDVFLGTPECDPCTPSDAASGKMVRLFIQLVSEGEGGIVVKLEGHALVNQDSGQITALFKETPQLPFSHMRFVLEGGPRAVLANPRQCGVTKATGDLAPWSDLLAVGEEGMVSDSLPSYEFEITQNCFGPQFDPSFVAGSPNIQAGAYTPFTLSFGRSDNDEFLSGIKQTMPPGLLGNLSGVTLCKEPQAAEGTCGAGSLIGHVQVLTGPGADPFLVSGGQVFLTEGYKGAPYGLSIVVPAVAGPYTLSGTTGKGTVVVRAKIEVDPTDAHLTVTSDPLPTVLDGIPLQLKVVNVTIDRAGGFTFNPTSCAKMSIGAVLSSGEGMTATKSSSFQVTNCASLAFKPTFKVSTSAKTSRTNGASLHVQLTYPAGSLGSEANIGLVKVELPKQLPSRLSTLQKACTAAQFNTNPAGCPAASIVGHAKASTPIIPVALEGPAYFVSHGGEAFPSLIVVLQGYGVSVDLVGTTFISKQGITSSTFKTVPDVPVGSFELTLPEGPYSALTNAGRLCKGTLTMPTTLQAQNGMQIQQATKIAVTGCPKAKKVTHKKHKITHSKKKRKGVKGKGGKAAARHRGERG